MSVPLLLVLLGLVLMFIEYQSAKEERVIDKMTSEMRILEEREELAMDRDKLAQRNKERIQGDVKIFLTNAFLDYSKEVDLDTYKAIEEFYKYITGLIEEKL